MFYIYFILYYFLAVLGDGWFCRLWLRFSPCFGRLRLRLSPILVTPDPAPEKNKKEWKFTAFQILSSQLGCLCSQISIKVIIFNEIVNLWWSYDWRGNRLRFRNTSIHKTFFQLFHLLILLSFLNWVFYIISHYYL